MTGLILLKTVQVSPFVSLAGTVLPASVDWFTEEPPLLLYSGALLSQHGGPEL